MAVCSRVPGKAAISPESAALQRYQLRTAKLLLIVLQSNIITKKTANLDVVVRGRSLPEKGLKELASKLQGRKRARGKVPNKTRLLSPFLPASHPLP